MLRLIFVRNEGIINLLRLWFGLTFKWSHCVCFRNWCRSSSILTIGRWTGFRWCQISKMGIFQFLAIAKNEMMIGDQELNKNTLISLSGKMEVFFQTYTHVYFIRQKYSEVINIGHTVDGIPLGCLLSIPEGTAEIVLTGDIAAAEIITYWCIQIRFDSTQVDTMISEQNLHYLDKG